MQSQLEAFKEVQGSEDPQVVQEAARSLHDVMTGKEELKDTRRALAAILNLSGQNVLATYKHIHKSVIAAATKHLQGLGMNSSQIQGSFFRSEEPSADNTLSLSDSHY